MEEVAKMLSGLINGLERRSAIADPRVASSEPPRSLGLKGRAMNFDLARHKMVTDQLERRGISDPARARSDGLGAAA